MKPSINLRYKSLLLTCLLILSVSAVAPAQITKIEIWQTSSCFGACGYGVFSERQRETVVYTRAEKQ